MINLDLYKNRTIDFTIGGKLVKVNEPSFSTMQSFEQVAESGIDGLNQLILKIMNNNCSGVKFSLKEVESWNKSMINAIIQAIADDKALVDNDPKY